RERTLQILLGDREHDASHGAAGGHLRVLQRGGGRSLHHPARQLQYSGQALSFGIRMSESLSVNRHAAGIEMQTYPSFEHALQQHRGIEATGRTSGDEFRQRSSRRE